MCTTRSIYSSLIGYEYLVLVKDMTIFVQLDNRDRPRSYAVSVYLETSTGSAYEKKFLSFELLEPSILAFEKVAATARA